MGLEVDPAKSQAGLTAGSNRRYGLPHRSSRFRHTPQGDRSLPANVLGRSARIANTATQAVIARDIGKSQPEEQQAGNSGRAALVFSFSSMPPILPARAGKSPRHFLRRFGTGAEYLGGALSSPLDGSPPVNE